MTAFVRVAFIFGCVFSPAQTQGLIGAQCFEESSRSPGTCRLLTQCENLRGNLVNDQRYPQFCGFQGTQSIVCCPNRRDFSKQSNSKNVSSEREIGSRDFSKQSSQCILKSSGLQGTCTFLMQCKKAREDLVKHQHLPQVCGFERTHPIVCCPNAKKPGDFSNQMCQEYSRFTTDERGQTTCKHRITKRIVKGFQAEITEFPHMAALSYENPQKWQCGGTVISEFYILTLASCATSDAVKEVTVGIAKLNDTDHRQIIKIDKVIKHPNYKVGSSEHDIALLKLGNPIELSSYVRPACLYTDSKFQVDEAIATGWGKTESWSTVSSLDLQKVTLSLVDTKSCNEFYKPDIGSKILPNGVKEDIHLCASGSDGQDTCAGDSGGPLQIEHTSDDTQCMYDVVGITSFGTEPCVGKPSVYTRVSYYVEWIEKIVWGQSL